ncbi:MAG: F0F1 ATP synthase subunit B [Planctomycetota bacterium]|jgi:F-type H+-transporting ATPase subunit b|nr:F0F1 ATP synthase subunit B [Planctomycetota bacterium]
MLIDWFTVVAQAVNFLILVWLLKRFLYKPVLAAIDAREARIAETVKNAESQKEAAEAEREAFARKNEIFDRQRADLLNQAREEADATRELLLENERRAADASREKWRKALKYEQQRFGGEIARRVQDEIFDVSRQVLADLADIELEERMIDVFERRLRRAKEAPDAKLAETLRADPPAVLVKSAFDLPEARRAVLRESIAETFGPNVEVEFETRADLIAGIELIAGGQKVAWAIADYLAALRGAVSDLLDGPAFSDALSKTGKK